VSSSKIIIFSYIFNTQLVGHNLDLGFSFWTRTQ